MARDVTLFIAMSEDGFIAGEDDSLEFLSAVQVEGEDYGYAAFLQTIDTVVVGRRTYDVVKGLGFPYHEDKAVYIVTRTPADPAVSHDGPRRWTGGLPALMAHLRSEDGAGIYCDGGAQVARQLLAMGEVDALVLSVIPTRLASGVCLFDGGQVPDGFVRESSTTFASGLVQHRYRRQAPMNDAD